MIRLSFYINNPFSKRFKNLFLKHGDLTPNKHWEFEILNSSNLIGLEFSWSFMTDHAGLFFNVALLTYEINFQIYDIRHWNDNLGIWTKNEK